MELLLHWHAYTWNGNGADLAREDERRPTSPDFFSSLLPPMRTGEWLAKPASRIAETFEDVDKAIEWMRTQYAPASAHDPISMSHHQREAYGLLPGGVDVQWGCWLPGGRFLTVGMICCPNRHVNHPCPKRGDGR
ncbi:hypothetical protein [Nonomuraea typhae]|uniref:hypothetical protein n=1 Tax=Nonomuraea typhae TaxID=2603600 RepID=UPI0012F71FAD|nr:hypothetical protein [Nonomuraea typhae]